MIRMKDPADTRTIDRDLTGKVALVTGASRGIGRAAAIALAHAGADVAVNFLKHEAEAKKVCAEIERIGRRAVALKADVSVASEVTALVESVGRQLGDIFLTMV